MARQSQSSASVLGCRDSVSGKCVLRLFRLARIIADRATLQFCLAHGESLGFVAAASFTNRTLWLSDRPHPLLPRAPVPAHGVGPLYGISLCVESRRCRPFSRRSRSQRGPSFWRSGWTFC